jgi:uncharacterized protein (DUF2141 family)
MHPTPHVLARPTIAGLLATPLSLSFGTAAVAADLTVEIDGVDSDKGLVSVAVFANGDDFPNKITHGQRVKAAASKVVVVFKDLPAGRYAVSAYHDANENKELDRGMFGIPKERYGFSQEARGVAGPPEFRDAAFVLPAEGTRISVRVR